MKVFVTVWSHRHGEDITVFDSAEKAELHRQSIAQNEWESEMEKPMPEAEPPNVIADLYFDKMGDQWSKSEFFTVHECEVQ